MEPREKTFTQIVDDYVQEKRAIGYHFDKASRTLRRIVDIQEGIDHGTARLSRELVDRWIEKTPWENETNRSRRISVLRGLGTYMARMGYDAVIVPQRLTLVKDYAYMPYIFSDLELSSLLGTVDQLCATGISTHSDLVFPLVFRILIGCGSRITETLQIEKKDVDVEKGTLTLLNTKNRKERIIPMADSLTSLSKNLFLGYFAFGRFLPIANFLLSKRSFLHSIMTIASIWCLLQAHIAPFCPSLYGIAKHSP